MAYPNTDWPTSVDTAQPQIDGVDTVWADTFNYQDEQIIQIQTFIGVTGDLLGDGISGSGIGGALSPASDGGTAFQLAARNDFTSGKLFSLGDDYDNVYSEKFYVNYAGAVYSAGSKVLSEAAGEIAALTAKATPTTSDYLVIEDAADSNNKKSVTLGDLPSGSTTDIRSAGIVIGNQANGDTSADCDALDTGNGTILKSTIEGASAGDYVFVRAGTYDLGSGPQTRISIPSQVRVGGAGRYQTHVKAWTGADGRVFLVGSQSELRDVYVEAPAPTTQTIAGGVIEGSSSCWIKNIRMFFTGTWPAAANVAITAGFKMTAATVLHLDDCWFWGMPNGDSGAAQVSGVDLSTCHTMINGLRTYGGYDALKSSGSYIQATQLNLQNFSHNGIYHAGSSVQGLRSSYSGGLLRGKAYVGITHDGVVIYTAAGGELGVNISDLYLMDSVSASAGVLGYGISIQNADRNTVSNCRIFDYGADGSRLGAIHLDANSDNNVVAINTMGGNTLVDLGTNNDCAHNL